MIEMTTHRSLNWDQHTMQFAIRFGAILKIFGAMLKIQKENIQTIWKPIILETKAMVML